MATVPSLAPRSMPTYEYACEKCGKNFDAFQSMRDEPFTECPKEHCQQKRWGHGKVKRLLGTGAGLIFKGSGFYITDYRSNNYKEGAKKEAPAPAATAWRGEIFRQQRRRRLEHAPSATPAKTRGEQAQKAGRRFMKLLCPECRRENEPERIYCHDCGARLDRSSLAKEKSTEEAPKETQRRLRSMLDPRGVVLRQRFFQGSKLLLGALGAWQP